MGMIEKGDVITTQNVLYTMNMIEAGEEEKLKSLMSDIVCITARGKQIRCKTYGQMRYVEAIRKKSDCIWNRTCRYGQDLFGYGNGYYRNEK